jgi:crotonobetainyl-CoA:carnitine CoA-transferase CaiB-like acyl-CoA transferase
MSASDWRIQRGGPCLGEHNDVVFGEILGLSAREIRQLRDEKVI